MRTCLWFDGIALNAAEFYCTVFADASIDDVVRLSPEGDAAEGAVLTVGFAMNGSEFLGLNGGPMYTHSPAVSFIVECEGQAELDRVWDALLQNGGQPMQCGWLTDQFGISWQIVPSNLAALMTSSDPAVRERVMAAFMQMVKFDIAALEAAGAGSL